GKVDQPVQHMANGKPVEPIVNNDNPPVVGPAARLHLSLGDWAKFAADQLKGAAGKDGLVKAATYKLLHEAPFKEQDAYTPGAWIAKKYPLGVILNHDGSNSVNYCTAALIPSKDVAFLVVTNQGGEVATKACQLALEEVIKMT